MKSKSKTKKRKNFCAKLLSQKISLKVLIPIYILLGFVILVSLVNFWFMAKVYKQYDLEVSYFKNSGLTKKEEVKVKQETAKLVSQFPDSSWWSFGDTFSSDAHLDLNQTDMFLDKKTTSLSFKPLFSIVKEKSCTSSTCDIAKQELILFSNTEEKCLKDVCLAVRDKKIFFKETLLETPQELTGQNIKSINISLLEKKWLVSFIVSDNRDETVYAYLFDGKKFLPLANNSGPLVLKTKFGLGSGYVAAGGLDDDFLLVYFGYESYAFQVSGNLIKDVSEKFGIRLADNGFIPHIVRLEENGFPTWYIISLTENKFKLIKLWQNNTPSIEGIIDLSELIREKIPGKITAYLVSDNKIKLITQRAADFNLYSFTDQGFDNSHDYIVTSKDVNGSKKNILAVLIKEIVITPEKMEFYFSDNAEKFTESHLGEVTQFAGTGDKLLWRLKFLKSNNSSYSPWFGGINYLDYLVR